MKHDTKLNPTCVCLYRVSFFCIVLPIKPDYLTIKHWARLPILVKGASVSCVTSFNSGKTLWKSFVSLVLYPKQQGGICSFILLFLYFCWEWGKHKKMDWHVSKKGFLNLLNDVQLVYKYIFKNYRSILLLDLRLSFIKDTTRVYWLGINRVGRLSSRPNVQFGKQLSTLLLHKCIIKHPMFFFFFSFFCCVVRGSFI